MNILLLLTGGTICSFENESGKRASDVKKAETLIVENFKKGGSSAAKNVKFTTKRILNVLSENMSTIHWNKLIKRLKECDFSKYDGVIILHGTDTLAYTAALLSLLLAGTKIPVMLVSSREPIYMEGANGNENFRSAVELIAGKIPPNIYAVYQNRDGVIYLHYASHLLQCENGSDDFFSCDMIKINESVYSKALPSSGEMLLYKAEKLYPCVLCITPYAGIDYSHYSLSGTRAILHGTYHSSTVPIFPKKSSGSIMSLKRRADRSGIPIYLSPCDKSSFSYETTGEALSEGIKALNTMTWEMTYTKLLLGCSLGFSGDELEKFLKAEVNMEFLKNHLSPP